MKSFKLWLSAGLGAGFLPKSPGTWGSLVSLIPIYFILISAHPFTYLSVFIILSCVINLWVADVSEDTWGKDPSKMVIDEFAGQGVSFLAVAYWGVVLPLPVALLLGFIFFRFFDILKPLGINRLQSFKGGFGILLDDLLAGVYAMACLQVLILTAGI
ncbi:MAG: phosphatidylglycerophosphatase A [Chitinophagales bacterium]|nr:phosphatidylglycerophosphatase A [Chitinophagales bacterium]